MILRPFPYPDADRLVSISESGPQGLVNYPVPMPTYADWRAQAKSFRDLAGERPFRAILSGDGEPQQLAGGQVSYNWFTLLGVPMGTSRCRRRLLQDSDSAFSPLRVVSNMSSDFGAAQDLSAD